MNRILSFAFVASFVPAVVLACGPTEGNQSWWRPLEPRETTVAELSEWRKGDRTVTVDVNVEKTREKEGVIPGAVLLSSSSFFELTELPSDKSRQLVFYCMNQRCGASHQAAQRALEAGYLNVAVLPVGITGWKAAGQPTAKMTN